MTQEQNNQISQEELEQIFYELRDKWQDETYFLSSTTKIIGNPNYQTIIKLGHSVIPLLLKDLAETRNHWFSALMTISGEDPVQEEEAGNIDQMVKRWLEWGITAGFYQTPQD